MTPELRVELRALVERTASVWKILSGPAAVTQLAGALEDLPGVADVIAGPAHVIFTYDGNPEVDFGPSKKSIPEVVREYIRKGLKLLRGPSEYSFESNRTTALKALLETQTVADLLKALDPSRGGPTRKVVPWTKAAKFYEYSQAILPAGKIDVATGANEYWDDGNNEVWSEDGRLFVVHGSGDGPYSGLGSVSDFQHDQTGRQLRKSAKLVGWFTTDPNGSMAGKVPLKGKLPVATYK